MSTETARPREEACPACRDLDNGPCHGPLCEECGCCDWNCRCHYLDDEDDA